MSSPVRRSLVLLSRPRPGAGMRSRARATGVLAKKPHSHAPHPDTRVAGINVDATTIPQLQALMNRHRLTSVQLTQFYLHRIKKLNPLLNAVITVSPTALADARAADKARRAGSRPAAPRHPGAPQGQRRHDGHADDGRLVGARGQQPERRVHRQAAPRRRRDRSSARPTCPSGRTSDPPRRRAAGAASAARPTWPTSSTATRAARAPGPASRPSADLATITVGTETDGSIVCPSGANARRRDQADPRPAEPGRHRPDLRRAGHRRPDHPQRDRRRRHARRHDRHRPQGSPRRPARPATRSPTTPSSSTGMRSTAPGSASGATARTTRPSAPRSTRS